MHSIWEGTRKWWGKRQHSEKKRGKGKNIAGDVVKFSQYLKPKVMGVDFCLHM
jgi:hypothetical protein